MVFIDFLERQGKSQAYDFVNVAFQYLKVCFQSYFREELETYFDLLRT